jgi:deoxyribodipyrimidine photolyase
MWIQIVFSHHTEYENLDSEYISVATYKETRNGLVGVDYSTKFSPWLALGCLSPRKIFWEVKKYEQNEVANNSTYWVIFELIWRDYFKFVCQKYGDSVFYLTGKTFFQDFITFSDRCYNQARREVQQSGGTRGITIM